MRSIVRLLGVEIAVPDFSTLSRRSKGLTLSETQNPVMRTPIQLVVDSTGLKIFGEGDWLKEKHKNKAKRRALLSSIASNQLPGNGRKLHLGPDLVNGEIVCSDLTTDYIGGPTALPDLLDQVDGPVDLFLADGAYDGSSTRDLLVERFGAMIEIAIPPPKNATLSPNAALHPKARDRATAQIKTHGRMAWQKTSGYNQRSRGETQIGRWQAVIGPKLKARTFENQKTEARIGVRVLNRMTGPGRPEFERNA